MGLVYTKLFCMLTVIECCDEVAWGFCIMTVARMESNVSASLCHCVVMPSVCLFENVVITLFARAVRSTH